MAMSNATSRPAIVPRSVAVPEAIVAPPSAYTRTRSPSKTGGTRSEAGVSPSCPQATFTPVMAGVKTRVNWRMTFASTRSPGLMNSAAPRLARARPFTRWWLAPAPMPNVKNRAAAAWRRASAITSSVLVTSPSVSTSTCRGRPATRGCCTTYCNAGRISVPPMSASSVRTKAAASPSDASSYIRLPSKSGAYVDPNDTMLKRDPGVSDRRHSCSALRTSAMESPPIDPERSTTKITSAALAAGSNAGRNESSTALPFSPCSTTACGADRPSAETTITRSRSMAAVRCARRTLARQPSSSISMGCDGDCTPRTAPLIVASISKLNP